MSYSLSVRKVDRVVFQYSLSSIICPSLYIFVTQFLYRVFSTLKVTTVIRLDIYPEIVRGFIPRVLGYKSPERRRTEVKP